MRDCRARGRNRLGSWMRRIRLGGGKGREGGGCILFFFLFLLFCSSICIVFLSPIRWVREKEWEERTLVRCYGD